ncbi:MAG: hypothetical protein Q8N84_02230 [bacterium]|nr:hypothetical protein [bacterium]
MKKLLSAPLSSRKLVEYLVLFLLLASVLSSAVYAGFWYGKKTVPSASNPPKVSPQSRFPQEPSPKPTGETDDWKVYTNEKYGFTFKYPSDFSIETQSPERVSFSKPTAVAEDYPDFSVSLEKTALTLANWIENKDLCPKSFDSCTPQKAGPIVGSLQFESINRHYASTDTIFKKGEVLFDFSVSARAANEPIGTEVHEIYDQILSTFKFLDQVGDGTAEWKTYTGEHFTFQYPTGWVLTPLSKPAAGVRTRSPNQTFEVYINPAGFGGEGQRLVSEAEITVDGVATKKSTYEMDPESGCQTCDGRSFVLVVKKGSDEYFIQYSFSKKDAATAEPIFDHILSTFQFLK